MAVGTALYQESNLKLARQAGGGGGGGVGRICWTSLITVFKGPLKHLQVVPNCLYCNHIKSQYTIWFNLWLVVQ